MAIDAALAQTLLDLLTVDPADVATASAAAANLVTRLDTHRQGKWLMLASKGKAEDSVVGNEVSAFYTGTAAAGTAPVPTLNSLLAQLNILRAFAAAVKPELVTIAGA